MSGELIARVVVGPTVVVLLVWLASVLGRRGSAAARHATWRAALVAFCLVPLIGLAAGGRRPTAFAVHVPVPASWGGEPAPRPGTPTPAARAAAMRAANCRPECYGPGGHLPRPPVGTATVLLLLWGAGALVGGLLLARDLFVVRRLVRTGSFVIDRALRERIATWSARVGLAQPPRLVETSAVSVPTVAGWWEPTLLLPPGGRQDGAEFDPVVIHELAHLRRGDLPVQAAARLVRALWWWHPLAWLAARELTASAEEACDDWVIALTTDRRSYAEVLVQWAEACPAAGTLACGAGGQTLVNRVKRILADAPLPAVTLSRLRRTVLAVGAVTAILAAGVVHLVAEPLKPQAVDDRLRLALMAQNSDQVAQLLRAGVSIGGRSENGYTALHWAAQAGTVPPDRALDGAGPQQDRGAYVARLLLDGGADVKAKDYDGLTPLHIAAIGNVPLVVLLLDHGADVNATTEGGETPLTKAAGAGRLEIVDLLLARGAAVDPPERSGTTPLYWAVDEGRTEVARRLIDAGASVNVHDHAGRTALLRAAGHGSVELVRLLLDHGADPNAADAEGRTPLSAAAAFAANGHPHSELTALLVARGARWTMDTLVLRGDLAQVRDALSQGADVNRRYPNDQGAPLLYTAAQAGRADVIELLLQRGADVNGTQASTGNTALHWAVLEAKTQVAEVLLRHGAQIDLKNGSGETPLDSAVGTGRTGMARLLLDHGATWTLGAAGLLGDADKARDLLAQAADPNGRTWWGATALHWAATRGDAPMARLLLEGHADPNVGDRGGLTPLHWAVMRHHTGPRDASDAARAAVAQLLLEHGADVNARSDDGTTPLIMADQPLLTEVLLEHGADPKAENRNGLRWFLDRFPEQRDQVLLAASARRKAAAPARTR